MSRDAWDTIKTSKHFYVSTYRKSGTALVFSLLLNLLLLLAIHYTYFNQPERSFYATNGMTAPIDLTPLDEPNYTSVPLLASNINTQNTQKRIPE